MLHGSMARPRRSTTAGNGGATGGVRPDDGGISLRGGRGEGRDDGRDLPEGASHGFEPAVGKRGLDDQRERLVGRRKGGLNTTLHAVADAKGRPLGFFMTAGQVDNYTGAAALLGSLPAAEWLIADRGHDAGRFRDALQDKGIKPCIPGRKSRGKTIRYDRRRYRQRNRITIT